MAGDFGSASPGVTPGAWVEVRNQFNGRWAAGFVVESIEDDGYRVRRLRDRELIDMPLSFDDVRPIPRLHP